MFYRCECKIYYLLNIFVNTNSKYKEDDLPTQMPLTIFKTYESISSGPPTCPPRSFVPPHPSTHPSLSVRLGELS